MPRRSSKHKGEQPVDQGLFYRPYGADHPVAHMIRTGSGWFEAWQVQSNLDETRLSRRISMAPARIRQLRHGAPVKRAEVDALAQAYGVTADDIIASLPTPDLLGY